MKDVESMIRWCYRLLGSALRVLVVFMEYVVRLESVRYTTRTFLHYDRR